MRFLMLMLSITTGVCGQRNENCNTGSCSNDFSCWNCAFPICQMGETVTVNCTTLASCRTQESLKAATKCRYCWQIDKEEYDCQPVTNCTATKQIRTPTRCKVHKNVVCKGNREFSKNIPCNWSSGSSWTTTMLLSVTLGGFGADRFYLGLWKSGIGKLFSFGGLGVWTVVDIVLIATGYIRPADGSLYL